MKRGTCGKNLIWTLDDSGTLTISDKGDMEDYGWIFGKAPWRKYDEYLKKVVIKLGVTSIGENAFCNCEHLTEITIPDSLTKIKQYSFRGCERLKEVIIPDSVTYIGYWAFFGCKSLSNVTLSANIKSIEWNAFAECKSLTNITIPNGVKKIDTHAFLECKGLTKIIIPNSVTNIGDGAFNHCTSLTEITIPASVTTIGESVFSFCESLKKIYYPSGRGFAKNLLEYNNAKLIPYDITPPAQVKPTPQSVIKPAPQTAVESLRWKVEGKTLTVGGVSEIKSYSYEETPWRDRLSDIQRIIIEDGVKKISANAFAECTRLEQLTIPASVKTIGDGAFTFCYCGDRTINGGRNVIWSLEDGTLMIKKNPAAKNESNFSTGYETWQVIEGNITGVKIERGIVPAKNFFDWLARMGEGVAVAF
ncbi:MAG: leucine-rich repeat domain-containing protein [Quinella sp. 1Q5]|nr:leucine-rich repeat domain-containing protein [Quinella sp. 1Q5]